MRMGKGGIGLVIFDLTATAKRREFFAVECRNNKRLEEAQEHERIAAQYRKAIEKLRGKT